LRKGGGGERPPSKDTQIWPIREGGFKYQKGKGRGSGELLILMWNRGPKKPRSVAAGEEDRTGVVSNNQKICFGGVFVGVLGFFVW